MKQLGSLKWLHVKPHITGRSLRESEIGNRQDMPGTRTRACVCPQGLVLFSLARRMGKFGAVGMQFNMPATAGLARPKPGARDSVQLFHTCLSYPKFLSHHLLPLGVH